MDCYAARHVFYERLRWQHDECVLLVLPICSAQRREDGLQSLTQWNEAFNYPTGSKLGLLNAIQNIGCLAAYPFSPYLVDGLGRRAGVLFGASLMIAATVIQTASHSVGMFIGARFLIGFGLTFAASAAPLLVTEVAFPSQRAQATSMYNTLWYLGSIIAAWTTFGTFNVPSSWAWRIPSALQGLPSVLQVIFIWFIPESPRWLVSKGREAQALKTLAYYHASGNEEDPLVEYEFEEIKTAIALDREAAQNVGWLSLVKTAGNRKRMRIILALAFFSQWSGNGLVSYYLNKVFIAIGIEDPTTQLLINGILNIFNFFVAIIAGMLCDKVGRRRLFMTSTIGMVVFWTLQTICFALYAEHGLTKAGHAVIAMIFLFYGFYDVRHSISRYVNPIALEAFAQLVYVFWLTFEAVFCYFFLIETKNLTLEETAALFDGDATVAQIAEKAAEQAGVIEHREDEEKRSTQDSDIAEGILGFTCNSLPCARVRSLRAACGPGKIPTVLYIGRVEQRHDYEQDAPGIAADGATYGCNVHSNYAWNSPDNGANIGMDDYRGSTRQWARRADEGQWGPMQIMAPILAGLGVALCFAGIYLYWYKKNSVKEHRVVLPSGVRGTRRFFGLFPSISYVRESNRSNTWTIEPRDDLENSSHGHGHTRLPSSPSNEAVVAIKKPRSRFLEALKAAIPTPWKRKPVTVQSIPARKGFRIDDVDRRTSTTPSRPSIAMTLDDEHAPGEHPWKYLPQPQTSSNGSRSGTENLFPGDDPGNDSDDDGENTEHEEEHTSLLSASSRMGHNIMLISHNGEDFTLESGDSQQGSRQHHGPSLNIVPPSPAVARPDHSNQPVNHPVLPPVPAYPAPQPSSTPRPTHRAALSPLQEAITLSPPPSIRPSPSNHSLASRHLDQVHQHTGASTLSTPLQHSPQIQGGTLRRTEHVRRPSFEAEAEDGAVLRPSAERMGWAMNNSLSSPHLPLPPHPSQSVRRTPSPDHRRILSAEDASHNHPYALSVPVPSAHLRSLSSDHIARPSTTDPDMLFPGSIFVPPPVVMTSPTHASRIPHLPPELQRDIFELTALAYPQLAPKLLLVASRSDVPSRIEPVIYRVIVLDYPFKGVDLFMRTLESKPSSFFAKHVKTLCLTASVTFPYCTRVLSVCTGVEDLICWCPSPVSGLLPLISNHPLRKLSIKMETLFPVEAAPDFTHPIFRFITHLDIVNPRSGPDDAHWHGLANLPRLTHLAIGDLFYWQEKDITNTIPFLLENCENLEALILVCGNEEIREAIKSSCGDDGRLVVLPTFHHPDVYPVYLQRLKDGEAGMWRHAKLPILASTSNGELRICIIQKQIANIPLKANSMATDV
ncbi:hypothetical protein EYR38_006325 [Pleurotus pulmonarius]|nr:hypothetical protein EYR38_006325 [Pleurotus pulmonarius]